MDQGRQVQTVTGQPRAQPRDQGDREREVFNGRSPQEAIFSVGTIILSPGFEGVPEQSEVEVKQDTIFGEVSIPAAMFTGQNMIWITKGVREDPLNVGLTSQGFMKIFLNKERETLERVPWVLGLFKVFQEADADILIASSAGCISPLEDLMEQIFQSLRDQRRESSIRSAWRQCSANIPMDGWKKPSHLMEVLAFLICNFERIKFQSFRNIDSILGQVDRASTLLKMDFPPRQEGQVDRTAGGHYQRQFAMDAKRQEGEGSTHDVLQIMRMCQSAGDGEALLNIEVEKARRLLETGPSTAEDHALLLKFYTKQVGAMAVQSRSKAWVLELGITKAHTITILGSNPTSPANMAKAIAESGSTASLAGSAAWFHGLQVIDAIHVAAKTMVFTASYGFEKCYGDLMREYGHNSEIDLMATLVLLFFKLMVKRSAKIAEGGIPNSISSFEQVELEAAKIIDRLKTKPSALEKDTLKELNSKLNVPLSSAGKRSMAAEESAETSESQQRSKGKAASAYYCRAFNSELGCQKPKGECRFDHRYVLFDFFKKGNCTKGKDCYFHHHDPTKCKEIH